MSILNGIDVSQWQGKIDWAKVKASGKVDFALLKAGYGKETYQVDPRFEENYAGCAANKIPVGAYWYSYATSKDEAIQEAVVCINTIKDKKFEYPIFLDIEERTQTNPDVARAVIEGFCTTMKNAGYYVGLYTYYYFFTSFIGDDVYTKYDINVAHYASSDPIGCKKMWQYSNEGRIPGIDTAVDLDYCYEENYPKKIRELGLNGFEKPTPTTPASKEEDDKYLVSIHKPAPENKVSVFAANDKTQLSEHFNVQEFKCKCGGAHEILVNLYLVWQLERIMYLVDSDCCIITSGYRHPEYDMQISKGFVGQHGKGNAADTCFYDKNKQPIKSSIISCIAQDLGVGGIANITDEYIYTHLDARVGRPWLGNECVSNNDVTQDFYAYYGITRGSLYSEGMFNDIKESASSPVITVKPQSSTVANPKYLLQGTAIILDNAPLYTTANSNYVAGRKNGKFWIYNGTIVNNRIRITTMEEYVNKSPAGSYVTGWVDISNVK